MLDIDWELMFRYCGQECSPEERARFERWLDADARHREFFDAVVRGAWRTLAPEPTPPAMRAVAPRAQVRAAFRWAWRVSLTAAAVVAVAIGLRRSGLFGSSAPVAQRERTLSTRAGERAQLALADGTRITLAPASTIRYWADPDHTRREITLAGEAAFVVAHDSAHPFIVRAGGGEVRDVGTTFDVRAYPDDQQLRVVVEAGRVDLRAVGDSASPNQRLEQGELGRLGAGGVVRVTTVDPARYLAWTNGRLVFDDTPLDHVALELTRWYGAQVVIADTALRARDFTGSFDGEPLRDVLGLIADAVHARVEWRADTARLLPLPKTR